MAAASLRVRVSALLPLAAVVTAGACGVLLVGAAHQPDPELASISLAGAEGQPALFRVRQLVPGRSATTCVLITADDRTTTGGVRLSAADLTGPLVAGLRVRVELGTGGGTGDCTGFTGSTVFDGPLTTLTPGVPTGWTPVAGTARTYRLTVSVNDDNSLQRSSANATLVWSREAAPAPTRTAEPLITADPAVTPAAPSSSAAPSSPASPSSAATSPAPPPGADPPPAAGPDRPPADWRETLSAVTGAVLKLLDATARHPWYLLLSLAAMWLFLFAADRSEKRDPKLALAPVTRDPYLWFATDDEEDDRELD